MADTIPGAAPIQQPPQTNIIPPTKPNKGKLELLTEFKKTLEKNGLLVADEHLLELFNQMTDKGANKEFTFNSDNSFVLNSDVLSSPAEQEIQIFPRGKHYFDKYKQSIDFNETLFNEMIDNFNNPKLFQPFIDENHNRTNKFADIVNIYKKPDGLYAKIVLNIDGIEAVKNNKYSYISPDWGPRTGTDKIPHNNVLCTVTMTNIPALEGVLPTLQSQMQLNKGENMKKITLDNMTEQIAVITAQAAAGYKLQEGAPGGIDPAALQPLVEIITELKNMIDELVVGKEQSEEMVEQVQGELNILKTTTLQTETEAYFKLKVSNGQLDPKDVDAWKGQYPTNKEFVIKMLDSRPVLTNLQQSSNNSTTQLTGFTDEDIQIAKAAGYDLSKKEHEDKYRQLMED